MPDDSSFQDLLGRVRAGDGDAGCRFAERMLTVVQTLRLQERGVIDYLVEAIAAHRQNLTAPKLLPMG